MHTDVLRWMRYRTSTVIDWPVDALLRAKGRSRVAVVLPALNEQETVGDIVAAIRADLVERAPLVDDLVVVDSGSTDRTAAVAATAGARVVGRAEVLSCIRPVPGKGEVLWRGLAATTADVVVFMDADLREFRSSFVTGLLGPLLTDPSVEFVKAMYDRPLTAGETVLPAGGGRVTELVARPLLNLHWPELAGFVQPLAGEYAARRRLLEQLPFPCGYGVEIGLLVDALTLVGLDAMAQVDVGVRLHRHQDDASLGRMSSEILQAALERLDRDGRVRRLHQVNTTLAQFERSGRDFLVRSTDVRVRERPPLCTVAEYLHRRARAS
jgi:glucosyl-3-phosphoglycerate synthase